MSETLRPLLLAVDTSKTWREFVEGQLVRQQVDHVLVGSQHMAQTELSTCAYTGLLLGDMGEEWMPPLEMAQALNMSAVLLTGSILTRKAAEHGGFQAVCIRDFERESQAAQHAITMLLAANE